MKIKTRLQLIIIATIMVFVGIVALNVWVKIQTANQHQQELFIRELNTMVFQSIQIRDEYFIYRLERSKQQWLALDKKVTGQFKEISQLFADFSEQNGLEDIITMHKGIARLFNQLITHDQSAGIDPVADKVRDMIISQMIGESHRLYLQCVSLESYIHKKNEKQIATSGLYNILSNGLLGLIMVMFAVLVIRNVTKPILRLKVGTREIAGGNFEHRLDAVASDEIGDLARDFDLMSQQLAAVTVSRDELHKEIEHRTRSEATLMLEVTERKRAEMALQSSLAEKEVLLKEVHHRVKNNLAAIMGLVDMQGQALANESARTAMTELSARIRSMSLVHEQLYQSDNLARINFQEYLETLISHLRLSYDQTGDIQVSVAATGVTMGLDNAVPCGLLVTELTTNAFKYAFPGGLGAGADRCEIAVSATWDGTAYRLEVADNGVGLPEDFDWKTTETLGLTLVGMLGEHQLQGKVELDRSKGTRFRLGFEPKGK